MEDSVTCNCAGHGRVLGVQGRDLREPAKAGELVCCHRHVIHLCNACVCNDAVHGESAPHGHVAVYFVNELQARANSWLLESAARARVVELA